MNDMQLLIHVHARFLHSTTGLPLSGNEFVARLYDKDIFEDDYLGEAQFDTEGKVHFTVNPKQYAGGDSPLETKPDFYLIVLQNGVQLFHTPVARNINFKTEGNFTMPEGEWIDLGTFII